MAEVKGKWDERQALPGNNGLFDIRVLLKSRFELQKMTFFS
jgi:hypothetical protein